MKRRKEEIGSGYPGNATDEEWTLLAPCLTLMTEDTPGHEHSLRGSSMAFDGLVRADAPWRMMPDDLPPWRVIHQQTPRWLVKEWSTQRGTVAANFHYVL